VRIRQIRVLRVEFFRIHFSQPYLSIPLQTEYVASPLSLTNHPSIVSQIIILTGNCELLFLRSQDYPPYEATTTPALGAAL
jgi:hypothetical protein